MPLLSVREMEGISPMFRGKLGNAFAELLIRFLSIDDVNNLYDRNMSLSGSEFASAVIKDIGMQCRILFEESHGSLSEVLPEGPFITVSNHPCGHVDGVALVDLFGHLRPDYKVMVNSILARVKPLEGNFISVTPTGKERTAPTASSVSGIKAAMRHLRDGGSLGLFPSGAVSDLSLKDRCVRDREWQDAVIRLIMKARVPVVPVRFFGGNSAFYYTLGLIDWRVRLLRLPAEVFNKSGRVMNIGVGKVITVQEQIEAGGDVQAFKSFLRNRVYEMDCKDAVFD